MKKAIQTSKKLTSPNGTDASMSFPEASPVNRSALPENGAARLMPATCGPKCLEQFGKFAPVGSWVKMFTELLIGAPDWYSSRCALTWKLKITPYNRTYFQLQVSMPLINDIERGLLLTPTTVQRIEHPERTRDRMVAKGYRNKTKYNTLASQILFGDLSTCHALSGTHTADIQKWQEEQRIRHTTNRAELADHFTAGTLPTPHAGFAKTNNLSKEAMEKRITDKRQKCLNMAIFQKIGQTFQLNPLFVEEMMGFPSKWTAYPFQNGIEKV